MSKNIKERRLGSANVPEDKRAVFSKSDNKQKRSIGRAIIIALAVLVLLISIALVVVNMLVGKLTETLATDGNYKDVIPDNNLNTDYIVDAPIFADAVQNNQKFKDYAYLASQNHNVVVNAIKDTENVFNYAIYGLDSSTDDIDVVIIASINKDTNKLQYILLDDKMLVTIPYAGVIGCLEDAYGIGGANLLTRTISQNYGVDIDGYMLLDMEGVASLSDNQSTKLEIAMTKEEIAELNEAVNALNERFANLDGYETLPELEASADRVVTLEGYYTIAYARGKDGLNDAAVFKLLAESTKTALSKGVSGVSELTEILKNNARVSTTADDFSSLLQLVALAADDVAGSVSAEDFADVLAKDELMLKAVYVKDENGVSVPVPYVVVDDYAAMVAELQAKLYK